MISSQVILPNVFRDSAISARLSVTRRIEPAANMDFSPATLPSMVVIKEISVRAPPIPARPWTIWSQVMSENSCRDLAMSARLCAVIKIEPAANMDLRPATLPNTVFIRAISARAPPIPERPLRICPTERFPMSSRTIAMLFRACAIMYTPIADFKDSDFPDAILRNIAISARSPMRPRRPLVIC